MGTLDKGLPISGNLVSFWWQAVAPALHSGWTNRRFQIGLAMGNDNNNDNNNSDYGLWRKGDAYVFVFLFFSHRPKVWVTEGPAQGTERDS